MKPNKKESALACEEMERGDAKQVELLWERVCSGDEQAYAYLYQEYGQSLFYYGTCFTSDTELVKDCIQKIFVRMYQDRENLAPAGNLRYYLFSSLKNELFQAFRKQTGFLLQNSELLSFRADYSSEEEFLKNESDIHLKATRMQDDEFSHLWNKINKENRLKTSTHGLERIPYYAVASCIALVIALSFVFVTRTEQSDQELMSAANAMNPDVNTDAISLVLPEEKLQGVFNQLIVPPGKKTSLTLSDGTKLWVNSGTRVVYPVAFNDKEREIYVDGEVYLEVVRNEGVKFTVKTGHFSVNVLGTAFSVRAYKGLESSVVLLNGTLNVEDGKGKKLALKPDQQIIINKNGLGSIKTVRASDYIGWISDPMTISHMENFSSKKGF